MPAIRVLLGALPAATRNAVLAAVDSRPDVIMVGVETQRSELLRTAGERQADVVIVAATADGLPGVASHLVDQYPEIRVLAVTATGTAWRYRLRPRLDEVGCRTAEEWAAAIGTDEPDEGGDEEWRANW